MRQSLKVALSLLISIILFSGFAVLAFSGLFNILETDFFNPRIQSEIRSELESLSEKVAGYHELNFNRFEVLAAKGYVASAYATNQSPEDISARVADFGALQKDLPNLTIIRLLDPEGKKIHFSTLKMDELKPIPVGIEYKTLEQVDDSISGTDLVCKDGEPPKLIIDGAGDRFIYSFPVYRQAPVTSYTGTAVFYMSSGDLLTELLRIPQTNVTNVLLVNHDGVLLDFPGAPTAVVSDGIEKLWQSHAGENGFDAPLALAMPSGASEIYRVFARRIQPGGLVSIMRSESIFQMSPVMEGLLLASFFLTVFLITFLLFNLRPDPLEVLSQRVKRFQIQLLEELMQSQGGVDWERWKRELQSRKGEITHQIQRGIGRVSRKQKPEIESYVSKSWDEILELLGRRAVAAPAVTASSTLDLSRLESLIQQALRNAQFVIPTEKVPVAQPKRLKKVKEPAFETEEVEELEEVEAAAPEEVEELEEAEAVEEAEEVEEAEAVEEAEEVGELEEAEAVEEAEEVEEAEAVEEAEEVEELEEAEAEGIPHIPMARAESISSRLNGLVEARIPPSSMRRSILESESEIVVEFPTEPIEKETFVETSEENLEELEPLPELQPLPPEPIEEGLEFLPVADEKEPASNPLQEDWKAMSDHEDGAEISEGSEVAEPLEELAPVEPAPERRELENIVKKLQESQRKAEEEPLEELEGVSEAEAQALSEQKEAAGGSKNDRQREIERLVATGVIRVYPLDRLQSLADEARTAIVIEDGVFRIKEEVYTAGESAREGKLKELVDEVISHEKREEALFEKEDSRNNGMSGIGDLITEEETIDLANMVGTEKERGAEESLTPEREKSMPLRLKKNGLDYDEFLSSYPRSFTHTAQMKSLVEISRRVSAVSAGILLRKTDEYAPDLSVGAGEKTIQTFRFAQDDPFNAFFQSRLTVVVNRAIGEIQTLRDKVEEGDHRYMKRLIFLPVTFRSQEAYLFFSFSIDGDISLDSTFSSLRIL
jgi:hypothetical protein